MTFYFRLILGLTVAWLCCWDLILNCLQVLFFPAPEIKPPSYKNLFSLLVTFFKPTITVIKPPRTFNFPFALTPKLTDFFSSIFKRMPADNNMSLVHLLQWIRDTSDEVRFAWSSSYQSRQHLKNSLSTLHTALPHSDLVLTAIGTLSLAALLRRSLRRFKTANDVPISFFGSARKGNLRGLAVAVNDSDNLRFYHQPHFFSLFKPNLSRQGTVDGIK